MHVGDIRDVLMVLFQSEKSFRKLRVRAFQQYHQILCISIEDNEDVGDVRD